MFRSLGAFEPESFPDLTDANLISYFKEWGELVSSFGHSKDIRWKMLKFVSHHAHN